MELIEFTPTREQFSYTFGGAAPVMRIKPGTALKLWTEDAFNYALRSVEDLASNKISLAEVNPQTGPFYVEGAEPGDTLAIHIVDLTPARSWGVSSAIPFFGGLTSTDRTATLQEPRRQPSAKELTIARFQGAHVAGIAGKLAAK